MAEGCPQTTCADPMVRGTAPSATSARVELGYEPAADKLWISGRGRRDLGCGSRYRVCSRAGRDWVRRDRSTVAVAEPTLHGVHFLDIAQHAQGHRQPNTGRDQWPGVA
jgi:hypothetical protein